MKEIRENVFETNSSSTHSFTARGSERLSDELNELLENTSFIDKFIVYESFYLMPDNTVRFYLHDDDKNFTLIKSLDKRQLFSLLDGYFGYYVDGDYKCSIDFSGNVRRYAIENNLTDWVTIPDATEDENDKSEEDEDDNTRSDDLIISLLELFSNPNYSLTIKKTSEFTPLIKIIENDTVVYLAVTERNESANPDSQGGIDSIFAEITQDEFDEVVKSFVEL
jgi:hypothetical protein